jgi:hypothetical protein
VFRWVIRRKEPIAYRPTNRWQASNSNGVGSDPPKLPEICFTSIQMLSHSLTSYGFLPRELPPP